MDEEKTSTQLSPETIDSLMEAFPSRSYMFDPGRTALSKMNFDLLKNKTLTGYALAALGITVPREWEIFSEYDRYLLEALARGMHSSWNRTKSINQELVYGATMIAQMESRGVPKRKIKFVSGPTEMLALLEHSDYERQCWDVFEGGDIIAGSRKRRTTADQWSAEAGWRDRSRTVFAREQAWWSSNNEAEAMASLVQDISVRGIKFAWDNPNDLMATFCHAWTVVTEPKRMNPLRIEDALNWGQFEDFGPRSTIIICDYPTVLKTDERRRAHCDDGPALEYGDGSKFYAWHGVKLEQRHIERNYTYDDILKEPNSEVRRAMVELYGAERYIKDSKATCKQQDKYGKLWAMPVDPRPQIDNSLRRFGVRESVFWEGATINPTANQWRQEQEQIVFVEVLNSTPEPDGSTKTYYLRVPPRTKTAKAGIAWTFGQTEEDYEPIQQT